MKMRRNLLIWAAALTVVAAATRSHAGQIFSFEDSETVVGMTPNNGTFTWLGGIANVNTAYQRTEGTLTRYEPTEGYVWGQSFESDSGHQGVNGLQDHTRSTIGATDGSYSMKVHDATGGFKWGTQVLFNNINDPRWTELTTGSKLLFDQSTPGGEPNLPTYQVGFGAINYSAGFLDSYNTSGAGNNYQFASGPASQTQLTTQSYIYDFGGQMRAVAGSLWPGLQQFVIIHFNTNSPSGMPADYYYDNFRVINEDIVRPTWKALPAAGGNWTDSGNWDNGVPNAIGAAAILSGRGASNGTAALSSTVTVPSAITVGSIIFDAQITSYQFIGASGTVHSLADLPAVVNYTLSGPGSLTFDVASGNAELYAIAGDQTINVPVTVNDNLRIDTSAGFGPDNNPSLPGGGRFSAIARPSLTFGQAITLAGGVTLRTSGAGTANFNGPITGPTSSALLFNGGRVNLGANVNVGSFTVAPAARVTVTPNGNRVIRTTSLTIGNGSITSTMDLANNKMIVDWTGSSPLTSIRSQIVSAYNGGAWNGPGLTSSMADANTHALGYGESSAVFTMFPATFGGQQVGNQAVLVAWTRYGDATLDGLVNLNDFNKLATNFGLSNKVWTDGDFTYDGTVNLNDFNKLASNFGLSASSPDGPTPQDWANLAAAIPEPECALVFAGVAASAAMFRRRRS